MPDARDIADELTAKNVRLSIGAAVYDPADPIGKMPFHRPGHVRRVRVRPGPPADPRRHGHRPGQKARLREKKHKLTPRQEQHLVQLYTAGEHTSAELAEPFAVAWSTVYRASKEQGTQS